MSFIFVFFITEFTDVLRFTKPIIGLDWVILFPDDNVGESSKSMEFSFIYFSPVQSAKRYRTEIEVCYFGC